MSDHYEMKISELEEEIKELISKHKELGWQYEELTERRIEFRKLKEEMKKLQLKIEIYEECRAIIAGERGMFICGEYTGKEKEYSTKSEKEIAAICGEKIKTMD